LKLKDELLVAGGGLRVNEKGIIGLLDCWIVQK
jgi:hypothetical protein